MINLVIKKDGDKVPFDMEKLKAGIKAAASEAGLSDQEQQAAAQEVSSSVLAALEGKDEVSSAEIKDKIIFELNTSYPAVAAAWKQYEETKSE